MDMYRRPAKLLEAVDKLVPVLLRWLTRRITPQSPPIVVIPLHKGTDRSMSDEQFKEFYWPSLRRFLDGVREAGLMAYVLAEGSYNTRLELFRELAPGTTIWHFDQTDLREAKRVLQGTACVQGNVPLPLLQLGSPEQVTECCRGLIEDVAPGGGYVLDAGAALDEAEGANVQAMIRAAKEYGVY
jgi:uroporphyrinogen-III decarboxylase